MAVNVAFKRNYVENKSSEIDFCSNREVAGADTAYLYNFKKGFLLGVWTILKSGGALRRRVFKNILNPLT